MQQYVQLIACELDEPVRLVVAWLPDDEAPLMQVLLHHDCPVTVREVMAFELRHMERLNPYPYEGVIISWADPA